MRSFSIAGCVLAAGLGLMTPAVAQPAAKQRLKANQKQKAAESIPFPGPAIQRFLAMPQEQREKALAQLPPERRQQVVQRLRRLMALTQEQRDQLVRHYDTFVGMPPVRRQLVRQAITRLRLVREDRRKEYLDSTEAKLRFTPDELRFIGEVVGLPGVEEE